MRTTKNGAPPRLSADLSDAFPTFSPEERGTQRDSLDPVLPGHVFAAEGTPAKSVAPPGRTSAAPRKTSLDNARTSRRDEHLPEPGTIIDKFRLEELIGVGGFAAVFRATHLMLDMPVALKLLRPRVLVREPHLVDALCEEARFAARIDHPNVVRVFDVTRTPDLSYVVMEFIEGDTLAREIANVGSLPLRSVVGIGLDVVAGLTAALEQGLIHRDIKPANIMLTRAGSAKIVDLSLARATVVGTTDPRASPSRRPSDWDEDRRGDHRPAYILGTPACIAPEQSIDPEHVDFRADIYSLGATLYHAALGVPPFSSRRASECVRMHREAPVPLPAEVRPGFPTSLQAVLLRMLEKDPNRRFSSYAALRTALTNALAEMGRDDGRRF